LDADDRASSASQEITGHQQPIGERDTHKR
jgi:hypothetical protein